jgi:hypothetical protein
MNYNDLLKNWDDEFEHRWYIPRQQMNKDEYQQLRETELPYSSAVSNKIYMALNTEHDYDKYSTMFNNLAKMTPGELKTAEQLLPEFKTFMEQNKLNDKEQLRLKNVYPLIAKGYFNLYDDKKTKTTFTEFLNPLNSILQSLEKTNYRPEHVFEDFIMGYRKKEDGVVLDKTMLEIRLKILASVSQKTTDCDTLDNILHDFSMYLRAFPETINQKFLSNFFDYIVPRALKKNDIFGFFGNKWACGRGKGIARGVGAADFAYKCYATEITPRGINDLLQMSSEVLGGDRSKFEQIRKDALSLNHWVGRDPIHDSAPGVNEVIGKMVAYYDAPAESKEKALTELKKAKENMKYWNWGKEIYDLAKYDEVSPRTKEKNIDILRRINKNMSANNNEVRVTEKDNLNALAKIAGKHERSFIDQVIPLVSALNQEILSAIDNKQTGFSPEMVSLIAWTDRRLARALNDIDFEKQMGFYKEEDGKEVLLFNELTHSAKKIFDRKKFDDFYEHQVKNAFDMEEAYQNIGNRQNNLLIGLYKQYDEYCHAMDDTDGAKIMIKARKERAGSGNTLKALQNLTLYKEASTGIGRKHLAERRERAKHRSVYFFFDRKGGNSQ